MRALQRCGLTMAVGTQPSTTALTTDFPIAEAVPSPCQTEGVTAEGRSQRAKRSEA